MHTSLLDAAAIALSTVFTSHKLQHAFFGGWAIISKGVERESKDLDCLVRADKEEVVQLLTKDIKELHGEDVGTWMEVPQGRSDYVAFLWKNPAQVGEMVLVEVFTGSKIKFPATSTVTLPAHPTRSLPILNTLSLFKGKLSACAHRSKPTDSVDVLYLASTHASELTDACKKLDSKMVGLAMSRYPELQPTLESMGFSAKKALKKVKSSDTLKSTTFSAGGRMLEGDVQKGLLF